MESKLLNLHDIELEELLVSDFIQKYEKLHRNFYDRLCRLHTTIVIIKKIEEFPFKFFITPAKMAFWQMAFWNFYHMAIIIIYTFVEKKRNTINLITFIKSFQKNIKQVFLEPYKKQLEHVKYDDEVEKIRSKVTDIRNKIVAHIVYENINDIKDLSISDLDDLFIRLKKLFDVFTFGSKYHETRFLDFFPSTIGGKPTQSHLDDIFDLIMKDSGFLNKPERIGPAWKNLKKLKQPEEIVILNYYRKKFGMPEV